MQKKAYVLNTMNRYDKVEWCDEFEDGCYDKVVRILYSNSMLMV